MSVTESINATVNLSIVLDAIDCIKLIEQFTWENAPLAKQQEMARQKNHLMKYIADAVNETQPERINDICGCINTNVEYIREVISHYM